MMFDRSTTAAMPKPVTASGSHRVTGIIELADGKEVHVDVMQSYGSNGQKRAAMHDVHQMKVVPWVDEPKGKAPGFFSTMAGRVGGLAVCSAVVVLVSWQIGVWFAIITR